MIGAKRPVRRSAKLLTTDADGGMRHLPRAALASFDPARMAVLAQITGWLASGATL